MRRLWRWITITGVILVLGIAYAVLSKTGTPQRSGSDNSIKIAVASNFMVPAQILADRFEQSSGIKPMLSFASTGKHFTQIANGAPFDVFLAADEEHPKKLEADNHAVSGHRFTYAIGHLVLWSKSKKLDENGVEFLKSHAYNKLAIANPLHAPYGQAAQEVLMGIDMWNSVQPKLVMGENIGQTYTYIATGNVDIGFVAMSQVMTPGKKTEGSYWQVPQNMYSEINQQAILLHDKPAARQFLDYLRSEESRAVIESYGYGIP